MEATDRNKIIDFYEARFQELGHCIKAVGWPDKPSQQLRFKILSDVANLSHHSILDLGCGFGDLYDYLDYRFDDIEYTGVDISPSLLQEAGALHPKQTFIEQDISKEPLEQRYDYVLSSGALSYKISDNMQHAAEMIEQMFKACTKGIAINFLSSYVNHQAEHNFHYEPEAIFSLAKKFSKWVSVRHDYPLWEFTLYMYHQPAHLAPMPVKSTYRYD